MADKLRSYQVMSVVNITTTKTIRAKSLDEAIELAKKLKETDFINASEDWLDSTDFRITGVYEG